MFTVFHTVLAIEPGAPSQVSRPIIQHPNGLLRANSEGRIGRRIHSAFARLRNDLFSRPAFQAETYG